MTASFSVGVQVRGLDDAEHVTATARRIEELGYTGFFSYDHIGTVDPFAPLVVAALATERLQVGPLVINNEFHHPVLLARTAATVDALTGGRLVLGMGTGYQQSEHDAIGMELRAPGPRVRRFGESLGILRELLDGGSSEFVGDHHRVDLDDLGVRPTQDRLPLLVGGHGPRVVALAGRHADVFQFTGLTHGEGGAISAGGFRLADVVERARWLEDAAGERNDVITRSVLVQHTSVGPSATEELPDLAVRFGLDEEDLADCPFVLVGSVEQVVDKLGRLSDTLGVSHAVIRDHEGFAPVLANL